MIFTNSEKSGTLRRKERGYQMNATLHGIYVNDITDTSGALHILKERSGKDFSSDTLHYLVHKKRLSAFVFCDSVLIPWSPEHKRHGQTLIFLKTEVYKLDVSKKKRGRGAKKSVSDDNEIPG
jgi:hypothetical protein